MSNVPNRRTMALIRQYQARPGCYERVKELHLSGVRYKAIAQSTGIPIEVVRYMGHRTGVHPFDIKRTPPPKPPKPARVSPAPSARDSEIAALCERAKSLTMAERKAQGLTGRAIALRYGVTPERIRQLYGRYLSRTGAGAGSGAPGQQGAA